MTNADEADGRSVRPLASEADLARVYGDLRRHAQRLLHGERRGHTLQATALVNEAVCKLLGETTPSSALAPDADPAVRLRALFAAISLRMRQVLIEHARRRNATKHGGGRERTPLDEALTRATSEGVDLIDLDRALDALRASDPDSAEIFQLRWCAGLSMEHLSVVLEISPQEAQHRWTKSRRLMGALLQSASPSP